MTQQIFIYGLAESGQCITRTVYEAEFEHYEKQGYKRNPIQLSGSVEKISNIIVKGKKEQLKGALKLRDAVKKNIPSDMDSITNDAQRASIEESQGELDTMNKTVELLETEIAEKEAVPSLDEKELGEWGGYFDDQVNLENFMLNLKSERSKKKLWGFLDRKGIKFDRSLSLKPLKKIVRDNFDG